MRKRAPARTDNFDGPPDERVTAELEMSGATVVTVTDCLDAP
jgi:hypothetical protein